MNVCTPPPRQNKRYIFIITKKLGINLSFPNTLVARKYNAQEMFRRLCRPQPPFGRLRPIIFPKSPKYPPWKRFFELSYKTRRRQPTSDAASEAQSSITNLQVYKPFQDSVPSLHRLRKIVVFVMHFFLTKTVKAKKFENFQSHKKTRDRMDFFQYPGSPKARCLGVAIQFWVRSHRLGRLKKTQRNFT